MYFISFCLRLSSSIYKANGACESGVCLNKLRNFPTNHPLRLAQKSPSPTRDLYDANMDSFAICLTHNSLQISRFKRPLPNNGSIAFLRSKYRINCSKIPDFNAENQRSEDKNSIFVPCKHLLWMKQSPGLLGANPCFG